MISGVCGGSETLRAMTVEQGTRPGLPKKVSGMAAMASSRLLSFQVGGEKSGEE